MGHFGLDPKLLSLQHRLHPVYVLQSCAVPGRHAGGRRVDGIGGENALQSCRVLGASKAGRAAAGYRPGRGVYSPVISGLVCSTRTKTRVQHRYVSSGMLFIADRRHHALQSQDLMQSEFEMHNISPKLINPT